MLIRILLGYNRTTQQTQMRAAFATCHVVATAFLDDAGVTLGACEHASLSQHFFKFSSCSICCQGAVMLNMQVKTHSSLAFETRHLHSNAIGLTIYLYGCKLAVCTGKGAVLDVMLCS